MDAAKRLEQLRAEKRAIDAEIRAIEGEIVQYGCARINRMKYGCHDWSLSIYKHPAGKTSTNFYERWFSIIDGEKLDDVIAAADELIDDLTDLRNELKARGTESCGS